MRDRSGDLQLFISKAVVGDEAFARRLATSTWATGSASAGNIMVTRKGELSVKVHSLQLLSKAVRPLPNKWKGLTDTDTRYRQRYADLIVNEEARRNFQIRHGVISSFRRTMASKGFIEVETPMLHLEAGGAHARPFVTHHNTLNMDMYLRIALELHLKRLIVGGMERVFEIGRIFRNEGISTRHNPEFTMMESYQAFADCSDVIAMTEELIVTAARDTIGTTVVTIDEQEVDLAEPWRQARMIDLVAEAIGVEVHPSQPVEQLRKLGRQTRCVLRSTLGLGQDHRGTVRGHCRAHARAPDVRHRASGGNQPTWRVLIAHDPFLTERFELFVGRRELANGYSELNDPVEQRLRFEDEQRPKMPATMKPARSTRTTCERWNMVFRQPVGSASAWTVS